MSYTVFDQLKKNFRTFSDLFSHARVMFLSVFQRFSTDYILLLKKTSKETFDPVQLPFYVSFKVLIFPASTLASL